MQLPFSARPRSDYRNATRCLTLLLAAGLCSSTGCETATTASLPGDGVVEDLRTVAYVRVTPAELKLGGAGDSATFRATALDSAWYDIDGKSFAWSVSDPDIAAVDHRGHISAAALGSVTVTATTDGVEGTAHVVIDVAYAALRTCGPCHSSVRGEHVSLGFTMHECLACHSLDVGGQGHPAPANEHEAVSGGFQLQGIHVGAPCVSCHKSDRSLRYSPAGPSDCISCHRADFDAEHAGTGFPTTCGSCHTPTVWSGGSFDHLTVSGGFDLVGVHTQLVCTGCHSAQTFEPLYAPVDASDCVACHQTDYDAEHAGSGYPTTCELCHTLTVWSDATFDHDAQYFPIFSGEHRTRWQTCDVCHPNRDDFAEFTCFNCHAHSETNMSSRHSSVSEYSYVPAECLRCHPDGTAP